MAQTDQLVADCVINPAQADQIQTRARPAKITLCVNTSLIAGILAMIFAGIRAYTQMSESFSGGPRAYVIGGPAAIPLAFGLWRLNNAWFKPLSPAGTQSSAAIGEVGSNEPCASSEALHAP
ncbi:hypothetical protein [Yoonia sp.]|uniref:hypothetical protein n=1 Tax=Yoonia sp. TaxID=2212373 RepID=UPI003976EDB8